MAVILLGVAKTRYDLGRYDSSIEILDQLLEEHSTSKAAPEAIFLRGLCRYTSTHDFGHLKEAYEQLALAFPKNEWTMRAFRYRLL